MQLNKVLGCLFQDGFLKFAFVLDIQIDMDRKIKFKNITEIETSSIYV